MQITNSYKEAEEILKKYRIVGIPVSEVTPELLGIMICSIYSEEISITLYEEDNTLIIEIRNNIPHKEK